MRAADVMTRPVWTVRQDDSIEQALTVLASHNVTSAPVVDPAGDLVGMVSEGDLLETRVPAETTTALGRAAAQPGAVVVADVMTRDVVVMPLDADLAEVAEAAATTCVASPVDDQANLTGIVSRDILRSVVRTDEIIQWTCGTAWTSTRTASAVDGHRGAEWCVVGPQDDEVERTWSPSLPAPWP
jgi:CBS-domain-containing membrane protein